MMLLGILAAQRVVAAIANLLTNGDFAQAGDGWTAFHRDTNLSDPPEATPTDRVAFANGAAQLRSNLRGQGSVGGIKRALNAPVVPGVTYRIAFDYAGATALGGQANTRASTVDLGGTRVRIDPLITAAAGTLTVDVTATTDNPTFSIWSGAGSNTNGLNIDNIVVTKL